MDSKTQSSITPRTPSELDWLGLFNRGALVFNPVQSWGDRVHFGSQQRLNQGEIRTRAGKHSRSNIAEINSEKNSRGDNQRLVESNSLENGETELDMRRLLPNGRKINFCGGSESYSLRNGETELDMRRLLRMEEKPISSGISRRNSEGSSREQICVQPGASTVILIQEEKVNPCSGILENPSENSNPSSGKENSLDSHINNVRLEIRYNLQISYKQKIWAEISIRNGKSAEASEMGKWKPYRKLHKKMHLEELHMKNKTSKQW